MGRNSFKIGEPPGTRTQNLLIKSLSVGLFSTDFEAKLLFYAYPYFSFKTFFFNPCFVKY